MSNRCARLFTSKYKLFNGTLAKNLKLSPLQLCCIHLSKMDTVSEAAKGWSNPGVSDIYEKTRPDYNLDSVEFLLEKVGALKSHPGPEPFTIVELGAGTGKFTRAVLKVMEKRGVKNFKIISSEPLKEMCEKFKEMVPDVEILQCPARDLSGLLSNSLDAILAAHCFHWFYTDQKAIKEIHRVLKPKGTLGLMWNVPDRSVSWIKEIEEMLDPKFNKIKTPNPYDDVLFTHLRQHGGFGKERKDVTSFKYSMEMTLQNVIDRYKGISVISAAKGAEKDQILLAIEQIMKNKPETTNIDKYIYKFVVKMHWLQKTNRLNCKKSSQNVIGLS